MLLSRSASPGSGRARPRASLRSVPLGLVPSRRQNAFASEAALIVLLVNAARPEGLPLPTGEPATVLLTAQLVRPGGPLSTRRAVVCCFSGATPPFSPKV